MHLAADFAGTRLYWFAFRDFITKLIKIVTQLILQMHMELKYFVRAIAKPAYSQ